MTVTSSDWLFGLGPGGSHSHVSDLTHCVTLGFLQGRKFRSRPLAGVVSREGSR